MLKQLSGVIILLLNIIALTGCVAQSKYQLKEAEADTLSKEVASLKLQHQALILEQEAIKSEYVRLQAETKRVTADKETLAKDKNDLEQVLNSKTDTQSRTISELRQRTADLEAGNNKLREDIIGLQKIKEEKVKEVSGTYEQLLENMKSEIAKGQVTISELKGKLTVNMEAAILFDSGKADVKPDGIIILLKLIPTLREVKDKAIRIEGHTDNVPIKSSQFPSNWELSANRAINVTRYLQQQGIDPQALSAVAFSEYKPVADNETREGRTKNRRIEITLVTKDQ